MPDESNTNTPDDTDDIDSTDASDEAIVMDDVEAEAGFLPRLKSWASALVPL